MAGRILNCRLLFYPRMFYFAPRGAAKLEPVREKQGRPRLKAAAGDRI
jgi:hypothetical protein